MINFNDPEPISHIEDFILSVKKQDNIKIEIRGKNTYKTLQKILIICKKLKVYMHGDPDYKLTPYNLNEYSPDCYIIIDKSNGHQNEYSISTSSRNDKENFDSLPHKKYGIIWENIEFL